MSELERRLRATANTAAIAASDAHAPRTVKRAIHRRRGLTLGAAGVATAVVIGSVAVGGLGLTDAPDVPSPSPTPDLALDRGSLDYATVPLPATSEFYESSTPLGATLCGQPAPEPSHHSDDFTATFELPETLELDVGMGFATSGAEQASITVAYDGQDQLPAFADGLTALFLDDGVVVGFSDASQPLVVNTFMPHQTRTYPWQWHGWTSSCDATEDAPIVAAGDYQVVWVSHVYNDLASAAQWSLQQDNFSLPAASDLDAFREGSFYCSQWQMMDARKPITCSPNAIVGFDLDAEAGTATVPYNTSYYLRDVDIVFASAPTSVTLTGEYPLFSGIPDDSAYGPQTEAMCGDFYSDSGGNEASLAASLPGMSPLPTPGQTLRASMWLWSFDWTEAQVAVPAQSRIWLAQNRMVEEEVEDSAGTTVHATYYGHEIVGWMDVESQAPSPVDLHIYDGPAEWPLTVTDAQWCDSYDPADTRNAWEETDLTGITAQPTTVTLDDGTQYTDVIIMLSSYEMF